MRYGDDSNDQNEQQRRVQRHEEQLQQAGQQDDNITLADMMMGRADLKPGKSCDRNGLSAEMLRCLPLVLVWRIGEMFNQQYSQPFECQPKSWDIIPATGIPKEGKSKELVRW